MLFDNRSDFYYRMGTLLKSGISIQKALSMMQDTRFMAKGMRNATLTLDRGGSLREALESSQLFDKFELELIVAGEKAGKTPETMHRLAQHYEKKAARIRNILQRTAYPVVLIHAAIFGPNLFILMQQGSEAYLRTVLSLLAIFYALVLIPFLVVKFSEKIPGLASVVEEILLCIPLLGTFLWKYQVAQAVAVLQGLYASGVPIVGAMEHVIESTKSKKLEAILRRVHRYLSRGMSLQEATMRETALPQKLRDLIATGEVSGQLEQTLSTAYTVLDEEADLAIRSFTIVFGSIIFIVAAGFVMSQIIGFYSRYFNAINKVMGH